MIIKVFFFIPNLRQGGASHAIINFLKYINKKNFDIHLIYLGKSFYKNLPKNIKVYKLDYKKVFFSFFEIKRIISANIFNNNKNVFISNFNYANVLSVLFLRKLKNLKIVCFERNSIFELFYSKNIITYARSVIIYLLIRIFYRYADLILTNSKNVTKEFKKVNINSKVVYSGLLENLTNKTSVSKKVCKIIAVGRLEPQKDYFTILKAINLIKNEKFRLYIYGEGSLKSEIKAFIKQQSLNDKVILCGYEINKDKIYSNANLLVHASIFEGIPNAIVEALSYEVPVIASKNHGGNSEVLNGGQFGDLFTRGSIIELSNKIQSFLFNPTFLKNKSLKGSKNLNKFLSNSTTKELENQLTKLYL